MYIAVLNTDEQISDVLEEQFPGCVVDPESESVEINGVTFIYYPISIKCMPVAEITVYQLEMEENI